MKLIIAIINNDDFSRVSGSLTRSGYSVTKLSTTGGFLLSGNATLLIGTEDEKVDGAVEIIKEHSQRRQEVVPATVTYDAGISPVLPIEVTVGGATIFVLDVEKYIKA